MIKPTSVNFTEEDRALLTALKDRTGMSRTEILRRLIGALGAGKRIVGLPLINPPLVPHGN